MSVAKRLTVEHVSDAGKWHEVKLVPDSLNISSSSVKLSSELKVGASVVRIPDTEKALVHLPLDQQHNVVPLR